MFRDDVEVDIHRGIKNKTCSIMPASVVSHSKYGIL